jgi:hypothetical protein
VSEEGVWAESYDIKTEHKRAGNLSLKQLATMTIASPLQVRRILDGKRAQIPKLRSVQDLRRRIFSKPLPKEPGQTSVGPLQPGDEDIEL